MRRTAAPGTSRRIDWRRKGPLLGVNRTKSPRARIDEFDPKQTLPPLIGRRLQNPRYTRWLILIQFHIPPCAPGLREPNAATASRCCELLVTAEDGRLRPFSRPDWSETHGLKCRRLSVRSDEVVFDNACVRASSRNTADQQMGAHRRAGRGDPRAGRSIEGLEAGDLAEVGAVAVV